MRARPRPCGAWASGPETPRSGAACGDSSQAAPRSAERTPRCGAASKAGGHRSVLELEDLSKHFGGVKAVDGVTLEVRKGDILGLIGPNGSGKSTIVNLVSGFLPPTAGRVVLDGEDVTGLPSHILVSRGIARTFQNI